MVKQYSRHRLTASVAYVTTLTYASTNDQWARFAHQLVSSPKSKPCQFSSVRSLWPHLNSKSSEWSATSPVGIYRCLSPL